LAVTCGLGILLAISGAFGTDATPLWLRLAYWVPVMMTGTLVGRLVADNILKVERWTGSPWLAWLAVTISVAVIMAPLIYGLGLAIGWAQLSWREGLYYLMPSLAIAGLMAGIGIFLNQVPQSTHAYGVKTPNNEAKSSTHIRPRFLERLPPRLFGARLIAIEAQDHYLKVYTSNGSEMLLMRLKDALAELDGIAGTRVHRSWWVAREAVIGSIRYNGKATLKLEGNLEAPVSRTYIQALREEKWL
jgi:hypothetical protein